MKFLCDQCKAKYQIADDKVAGKTVRMKCRKCGHLIEVRAAVTESSAVSAPPPAQAPAGAPPPAPKPVKPAPPRSTPLAASLTSPRPAAPKPDRVPGTLAGTFKSSVQREEEISAPFDMSELSPSDDWYVAIHGVPVGPIRVGEIRRKAALGAVTAESLVWQEGLDEWRPLRTFPELAAIVREAASAGRPASLTPPPGETRSSVPPPAPRPLSARPSPPAASPGGARTAIPRPAAVPRNNVVPITSRLATAEKLEDAAPTVVTPRPALSPTTETRPVAAATPDPFGTAAADPFATVGAPQVAGATATAGTPVAAAQTAAASEAGPSVPPFGDRRRRGVPWIPIAMVAAAVAFGVTAAVAIFFRPSTPAPQPVVVQVPVPTPVAQPTATVPTATADVPSATPPPTAPSRSPGASTPRAAATGSGSGRTIDLHGLTENSYKVSTGDEGAGNEGAPAAGQCITQGQLLSVLGQHQVAVRRTCWDRNQNTKASVSVSVSMTIMGDGSTQGVSASGDDPAVAHCIENEVRGWHFPANGCSQKVNIPFKFVRQ